MHFTFADIDGLKSSSSIVTEKSDAHKIEDLQRQLAEKDILLEHLIGQIERMKTSYHGLIERTDSNNVPALIGLSSDADISQTYVGQVPVKEDEGYFNTYAHFDIHHDMLSVSWSQKLKLNWFQSKWFESFRILLMIGHGMGIGTIQTFIS